MTGGSEAKVRLFCGHCGRLFAIKEETVRQRRQQGKWLPYCSADCTEIALERAIGARPSGS